MTDVQPDRASRFKSARQQVETQILHLCQSVTACLGNYLPSVAFVVKRETAAVNKKSISFHLNLCITTAILGAAGGLANIEGCAKNKGVWAKNEPSEGPGQRVKEWAKNAFCGQRCKFAGQRNSNHVNKGAWV